MVTSTDYKNAFVLPLKNPVTDEQSIYVFPGNGAHKLTAAQKRDFTAQAINDIMSGFPDGVYLEFGDVELLLQQRARFQPHTEVQMGSNTAVVRTGIIRYVVDPARLFIY